MIQISDRDESKLHQKVYLKALPYGSNFKHKFCHKNNYMYELLILDRISIENLKIMANIINQIQYIHNLIKKFGLENEKICSFEINYNNNSNELAERSNNSTKEPPDIFRILIFYSTLKCIKHSMLNINTNLREDAENIIHHENIYQRCCHMI